MKNFFSSKLLVLILAITLVIPIFNVSLKAEQDVEIPSQEESYGEIGAYMPGSDIELLSSTSNNTVYYNNFDDDINAAYGWYAGYGGELHFRQA